MTATTSPPTSTRLRQLMAEAGVSFDRLANATGIPKAKLFDWSHRTEPPRMRRPLGIPGNRVMRSNRDDMRLLANYFAVDDPADLFGTPR